MPCKFLPSDDKEAGITLLASSLIQLLNTKLLTTSEVNILMSGGNTPLALYKELLTSYPDFKWERCRFIILDERYVSFDSNRSNAGECYRHFVQYVNLLDFIYPDTSLGIEECVKCFSNSVQKLNADEMTLALLGTATDGHIASIFPGNTPFISTGSVFSCKVNNDEVRVSLSLDFINQSSNIWMMAFGADKQGITQRAINNECSTLPALSLNKNKNLTWYISGDK